MKKDIHDDWEDSDWEDTSWDEGSEEDSEEEDTDEGSDEGPEEKSEDASDEGAEEGSDTNSEVYPDFARYVVHNYESSRQVIQLLQEKIKRKEEELARREKELAPREKELARREEELERAEEKLASDEKEGNLSDAALRRKHKELAGEHKELAQENTELAVEHEDLACEYDALAELEDELADLRNAENQSSDKGQKPKPNRKRTSDTETPRSDKRDEEFMELNKVLPEFIPFTVPCLSSREKVLTHSSLFEGTSWFDYPVKKGWTIHTENDSRKGTAYNAAAPTKELDKLPRVPNKLALSYPPLAVNMQLWRIDKAGKLHEGTYGEQIAFLQEWLFFGLLLEVSRICGLELDIEKEFLVKPTRKSGGKLLVSTEALKGLAERWVESAEASAKSNTKTMKKTDGKTKAVAAKSPEKAASLQKAIKKEHRFQVVQKLCSILGFIDAIRDPIQKPWRFGAAETKYSRWAVNTPPKETQERLSYDQMTILWSIKVLWRAVMVAVLQFGADPGFRYHVPDNQIIRLAGNTDSIPFNERYKEIRDLVDAELVRSGMCPSEQAMLRALAKGYNEEYLFYAGQTEREKVDHNGCNAMRCVAHNVDETKYETAHASSRCTCKHVAVNVDDVVAILDKDEIPVVLISKNMQLSVVSRKDRPYVAISHVWSHGLGNPTKNSLPKCQIRRLRDHISNLHKSQPSLFVGSEDNSIAIWIDTLCIPVAPQLKPSRVKAIGLLGTTFTDTTVLVLDKELEAVDSREVTVMERNIRICCSVWMRRLWTLQEGMLSRELFVQFKGEAVRWNRTVPAMKYGYDPFEVPEHQRWGSVPAFQDTIDNRLPVVTSLRVPDEYQEDMGTNYVRLLSAVRYRSTSKMEDEPLILGHIMGLNMKKYLANPDKMGMFHAAIGKVPGDLIFIDLEGKSVKRAPFRWAPSTLLESEVLSLVNNRDLNFLPARCDEQGLHTRCEGLIFSPDAIKKMRTKQEWSEVDFYYSKGYKDFPVKLSKPKGKWPVRWPKRPALIINYRHVVLVDILRNDRMEREDSDSDDRSQPRGEITVTILAYGSVDTKAEDMSNIEMMPLDAGEDRFGNYWPEYKPPPSEKYDGAFGKWKWLIT